MLGTAAVAAATTSRACVLVQVAEAAAEAGEALEEGTAPTLATRTTGTTSAVASAVTACSEGSALSVPSPSSCTPASCRGSAPLEVDHRDVSLVWVNESDESGPRAIYVGSEVFSRYRKGLDKFGITCIVNCTLGGPCRFEREAQFRYHVVSLSDDTGQNLLPKLPTATAFIEQCNGAHVLVHCTKGVSRSVSVLLAWMIEYRRMPLRAALAAVRARRSIADPNIGFVKQLIQYEEASLSSVSFAFEDMLPCPLCLQVRLEPPGAFECGHRCCETCLASFSSRKACAHCLYETEAAADVVAAAQKRGADDALRLADAHHAEAYLATAVAAAASENEHGLVMPAPSTPPMLHRRRASSLEDISYWRTTMAPLTEDNLRVEE